MARKQRQFKFETVMEVLRGEKPIAQICRERAVTDSLVYKWRSEFLSKAPEIFEKGKSNGEHNELAERVAELERLVGQLSMENMLLKRGAAFWKQPGGETGCDKCSSKPSECGKIVRVVRVCAQHILLQRCCARREQGIRGC